MSTGVESLQNTICTNTDKINFVSLAEETILAILIYLNQFDIMNIRLLNKKLNRIGSIKLFSSIYVYLPEFTTLEQGLSKSKTIYWSFFIDYTSITGYNNFKKLIDTKQLSLVRNVVLWINNPNEYSDYCYNYLIQNCPWVDVGVDSYNHKMFKQQFARLDKISLLSLHSEYLFHINIEENFSIRELYIIGKRRESRDPFSLIPKLKGLTLLYIDDNGDKDMIDDFNKWNISGLKLKTLGLHVSKVALKELDKVFVLDEIVSFELHFVDNVKPYKDLKWLCSQMKKLRIIHITGHKLSFEKVMHELSGHRLYQICLEKYGPVRKKITADKIEQLLSGHDSVTRFEIRIDCLPFTVLDCRNIYIDRPPETNKFKTKDLNYKHKTFPNTKIVIAHMNV
ncbi:hypothetical protein JA1_004825 [Spathaspora sp. JA1]|nr:hypothetical protein JA1_004825 [Spathaspora sp. JA1]